MQIGYIGLGAMGSALAGRLLPAHKLVVWDLNDAAVAAFERRGAATASGPAELARQCDMVLLCLPRSADVQQVVFGPGGLAEGLSPGKIVVDQTSGIPGVTQGFAQRLAERGVGMIDAPVSGGVAGAAGGTISILASGPGDTYEKALPVLTAISPNVFRCGSRVGDGQAMKLVNNVLSAGGRLATLEVVAMGRKMGLSLASITDVVNKGSGRNRTSKLMLQNMIDGKTSTTSFAMALMLKDLNQAISLGMDYGAPMPITSAVRALFQICVSQLGDKAQLDELLDLVESMARTRIADDAPGAATQPTPSSDGKALRVGYVGLGAMGGALARRLMLSRRMRVHDARAEVVASFASEGAEPSADLPSLARECDVIFVCVPTSAIVRDVVFGPGGLAEGLTPGKIIVDQTTGDPSVTREIAAELHKMDVALVDAPVSGGPRGAVAGTIALICGGPADAYAKVRPILESISPNTVYCGATGNGHVAKLIQNTVASCNRLLTYEAAALGVKYGLKLADIATVINKSTGWSGASERILPTLSEGKATADFQLALMAKDLKLAGRMAADCGAPMLIASEVRALFEAGANEFGGTANLDEMRRLYEAMAGATFTGA
jgi:3-hydroxyisobutyrate dehydrogenase